MVMTLVWHDAQSFRQHVEAMRTFRQSHCGNPEGMFKLFKDMPTMGDIIPPSKTGGTAGFIGTRSKSVIVPIWEIALPRGSQN